jgi:predicted kinase
MRFLLTIMLLLFTTLPAWCDAPTYDDTSVSDYFLTDDGNLSVVGERLLNRLEESIVDSAPSCKGEYPVLILTGGAPASGKSTLVKHLYGNTPPLVHVDPDELKLELIRELIATFPELKSQIQSDKDWSEAVHPASVVLGRELSMAGLASGKDVLLEGTLRKPYNKVPLIQEAREAGYKVRALVVDVPLDISLKRALRRAERPLKLTLRDQGVVNLSGRTVPPKVIERDHSQVTSSFTWLVAGGYLDSYAVYDSVDGPRLLAEYVDGQLNVSEPKDWTHFLRKGDPH